MAASPISLGPRDGPSTRSRILGAGFRQVVQAGQHGRDESAGRLRPPGSSEPASVRWSRRVSTEGMNPQAGSVHDCPSTQMSCRRCRTPTGTGTAARSGPIHPDPGECVCAPTGQPRLLRRPPSLNLHRIPSLFLRSRSTEKLTLSSSLSWGCSVSQQRCRR